MPDDASTGKARDAMECHCVTRWSGTERETDNSGCALHNDEVLRILTRDEEIVQLRQALRTLEAEREAILFVAILAGILVLLRRVL
jgi:hypothetical protein